ncbi:MAG: MoaD/ThiS family protein [Acidobacteriota bacterium]
MAIVVRLPATLRALAPAELIVSEPVGNIAALVQALDRQAPGLAAALGDPLYNVAVNDELLLHGERTRRLADGDIVEFVPTIAGGAPADDGGRRHPAAAPTA